jgi:hypothetical protein
MTKIVVTVSFNAMNSQTDELVKQEINETFAGLLNSLRTQVNDVKFDLSFEGPEQEKENNE